MSPVVRRVLLVVVDALLLSLCWVLAYSFRFEFAIPANDSLLGGDNYVLQLKLLLPWIVVTHVALFWVLHLYRGMVRYSGTTELRALAAAGAIHLGLWMLFNFFLMTRAELGYLPQRIVSGANTENMVLEVIRIPWGILAFYFLASVCATGGVRFSGRLFLEASARGDRSESLPTLLVGAGDLADSVLRSLQRSDMPGVEVTCAVASDPLRVGVRIQGVPVVGTVARIADVIDEHGIKQVLVALDDQSPESVRRVIAACEQAGVRFRIVPSMEDIAGGRVEVGVREVRIEDLLGREPVRLELPEEQNYIAGERVLITGAGGSIGSELARQVARSRAADIFLVGKGENSIYDIQRELASSFPKVCTHAIIADVRDADRMEWVFAVSHPTIVFHAAAHKHVPLMESAPDEAVKNNVFGTATVVDLAHRYAVRKFVLVSTDKAVRPVSVMGATKRLAEMLVFSRALASGTAFHVVRFGNVLGSRGSVIPQFRAQIEAGGPVTVTHPDVTRFFMTIPEAVSLMLQAGNSRDHASLSLLDMGKPVRIVDLARSMITLSGLRPDVDVRIEFIGLRPGEKLHEELLCESEPAQRTEVEKLYVAQPPRVPRWEDMLGLLARFDEATRSSDSDGVLRLLQSTVEDYAPANRPAAPEPVFAAPQVAPAAPSLGAEAKSIPAVVDAPELPLAMEESQDQVAPRREPPKTESMNPLLDEVAGQQGPLDVGFRPEPPRTESMNPILDGLLEHEGPLDVLGRPEPPKTESMNPMLDALVGNEGPLDVVDRPEPPKTESMNPMLDDLLSGAEVEAPSPAWPEPPKTESMNPMLDELQVMVDPAELEQPRRDPPATESMNPMLDELLSEDAGPRSLQVTSEEVSSSLGDLFGDTTAAESEPESPQPRETGQANEDSDSEDIFTAQQISDRENDAAEPPAFADPPVPVDEPPADVEPDHPAEPSAVPVVGAEEPVSPAEPSEVPAPEPVSPPALASLDSASPSADEQLFQQSERRGTCVAVKVPPGYDPETLPLLLRQMQTAVLSADDTLVIIAGEAERVGLDSEHQVIAPDGRPEGDLFAEALEYLPGAEVLITMTARALLSPGAIQRFREILSQGGAVAAYSHYIDIRDGAEREVTLLDHEGCFHERFDFGPVIAYSVPAIERVGGINAELRYAWEYDLHLRLLESGAFRRIPEPLYHHFAEAGSGSAAALHSPGIGPLGGFSYVFYPEEMDREVTAAFEAFLRRQGAWIDHPEAVVDHGTREYPVLASVVIPVLNRARFIGNAIESAIAGDFQDFEIIVVDNGSSDGTIDVVLAICARDPRVRLIHGKGGSIASALNEGIRQARGKYICQLDSDDEYAPGCLGKMTAELEANPRCGLAISYYRLMDEAGRIIEDVKPITHAGYTRNQILRRDGAGAVRVFARAVMEEFGLYDEEHYGNFGEDYDMVLKVGEKYEVRRVHEVLYHYRRHEDNTDVTRDPVMKFRNKNRARYEALSRRIAINQGLEE